MSSNERVLIHPTLAENCRELMGMTATFNLDLRRDAIGTYLERKNARSNIATLPLPVRPDVEHEPQAPHDFPPGAA